MKAFPNQGGDSVGPGDRGGLAFGQGGRDFLRGVCSTDCEGALDGGERPWRLREKEGVE